MTLERREVLERPVVYKGEGISVRALEQTIGEERARQERQISGLAEARERNAELQEALTEEMSRLRTLSEQMGRARVATGGLLSGLLARLGIGKAGAMSRRSVEELLRRQFEVSSVRLKEASELVDRLEATKRELYDEMERLGRRIVESAENEEAAADYVAELRALAGELDRRLALALEGSAESRTLQLDRDRTRRLLAEHTTQLRLHSTAEERLARLRASTAQLAETIAHLQGDIARYVAAAAEKMDLIAGQIQAIGAAADASMVMLELKQSLDAMTESMNHTTRFVAETQLYFKQNVDSMIDELRLYDEETEAVLAQTAAINEGFDELDVEKALSAAIARKAAAAAGGRSGG